MKNKQENYTSIPHSLMCRKDLTDQDKLTLGVIISFINNDKECFIGNDRLGDMLGISKNAASKRILRLQELGCITLKYTYKDGKKEVDKRYITFVSFEPQVCPDRIEGIVPQTIGYSPTDDRVWSDRTHGVCPKVGGIKQPLLLNNLKDNVLDNTQNKEKPVEDNYSKAKTKSLLCRELNITSTQFNHYIVEGNTNEYHNQELLNQYQDEINKYWN